MCIIQAMALNMVRFFWVPSFKGTYLPQNRVLAPRLETEQKPFQKHVHSPLLQLIPHSLNSPLEQCYQSAILKKLN